MSTSPADCPAPYCPLRAAAGEPAACRVVKCRERRVELSIYLRKVKGKKLQLRFWAAGYGSVNLGLFDDEHDGERVRCAVVHCMAARPVTPVELWRAARKVAAMSKTPTGRTLSAAARSTLADLLPQYVERRGREYVARTKIVSEVLATGPYPDPESAHLAFLELVRRRWPLRGDPELPADPGARRRAWQRENLGAKARKLFDAGACLEAVVAKLADVYNHKTTVRRALIVSLLAEQGIDCAAVAAAVAAVAAQLGVEPGTVREALSDAVRRQGEKGGATGLGACSG